MKILNVLIISFITILNSQVLTDSFRIVYDKDYYMILNEFDYNYIETIPKGATCITVTGNDRIILDEETTKGDFIDLIENRYGLDTLRIIAKIDSLNEGDEKEKKKKDFKDYKEKYYNKMNKLKSKKYIVTIDAIY